MEMNFGLADLYPSMGFYNTRNTSIPEAEDQAVFVDEEDIKKNKIVDGKQKNSIWGTIIIVLAVIILLSRR
jgi:hypothetical protein